MDAIDNLVATRINSDGGIVNTIKQLDTKLSEAIMTAMENGPELETKVSDDFRFKLVNIFEKKLQNTTPFLIKNV